MVEVVSMEKDRILTVRIPLWLNDELERRRKDASKKMGTDVKIGMIARALLAKAARPPRKPRRVAVAADG